MTKEEAIKLVKRIKGAMVYTEEEKEALETLIPELRESDDERIRKALVKYFEERNNYRDEDETFNGIPFPTIIAYLEKQKEQTLEAYKISDERATAKMEGRIEGRQDVINNPEEYGLQKPAEWSEEDEKMLHEADVVVVGYYRHSPEYFPKEKCEHIRSWLKSLRPQPKQEWSEEDEDMFNDILLDMGDRREMFKSKGETTFAENTQRKIDWLDSHHLQLKYQSSCPQPKQEIEWTEDDEAHLKWLCRIVHGRTIHGELSLTEESELGNWMDKWLNHSPQPKQEWSEEDEDAIKTAIRACHYMTEYYENSTQQYEVAAKRLKSFRPQISDEDIKKIRSEEYTKGFNDAAFGGKAWKPSEEQIEALEYVIRDYREDGCNATANYLQEILDHLKNM